jgi:hypothetical protein
VSLLRTPPPSITQTWDGRPPSSRGVNLGNDFRRTLAGPAVRFLRNGQLTSAIAPSARPHEFPTWGGVRRVYAAQPSGDSVLAVVREKPKSGVWHSGFAPIGVDIEL